MSSQESTQARSNSYRPVEIEIGGRKYTLRLTWRAIRLLREQTEGRIDCFESGWMRNIRNSDLPLLIWACIRHKKEGGDPEITLEEVEDTVELGDSDHLAGSIFKMLGIDLDLVRALAEETGPSEEEVEPAPLEDVEEKPTP